MKSLPIGIQTFEKIRRQDFLYIDKTAYFDRLLKGGYFFFSRPRRFGKSLLISTLEALFQGKKSLFDGLAITNSDYQFPTFPVIRLDFSSIANTDSALLERNLRTKLARIAEQSGLSLPEHETIEIYFEELILGMTKQAPLVLLVDEYDKPILDQLSKPAVADANRDFLRRFFGVLKSLDAHIHLVFLTGITIAKVSLFSELNNLSDMSGDDRYATFLGWTKEEMEANFAEYFQAMAHKLGYTVEQTLAVFSQMYNGYRFSPSAIPVFNPWSVINALEKRRIANYWYDSGSPKFLMDEITRRMKQAKPFDIRALYDFKVSALMMPSLDINNAELETLLLQAGYLTIKYASGSPTNQQLHIGFPNQEVEASLLSSLLAAMVPKQATRTEDQLDQLVAYLEREDLNGFFTLLRDAFFANIPYELHMPYEKYYQTVFHTIFLLLKVRIQAEASTNQGRIDNLITTDHCHYIIEFKWNTSAASALQQIKDKDYAGRYRTEDKKIIAVGVGFADRNIKDLTHEVLS